MTELLERLRDPFKVTPQDAAAAADKIEELTSALRNLQHRFNEAADARDRERARGDIAMEFIRMATKDMVLG